MTDCLSLLRQFTIETKTPQEHSTDDHDNLLVFGDFAWPKSTKTNYKMYSTGGTDAIEYYTLESIWFLLRKVGMPHTQYVREAAQNGIPAIRRPDRMELLQYLQGQSNQANSLDLTVDLVPAIQLGGGAGDDKMDEDDDEEDQVVKTPAEKNTPRMATPKQVTPMQDEIGGKTPDSDHEEFPDTNPDEYDVDMISTSYVPSELTVPSDIPSKRSKLSNGDAYATKSPNYIKSPGPHSSKSRRKPDKSATEQLGKAKIASIRDKMLRKKGGNVPDQEVHVPEHHVPMDYGYQKDLQNEHIEIEPSDVHKIIKERERTWQTRHSVLQIPSKTFKDVLKIMDDLHKDRKGQREKEKESYNRASQSSKPNVTKYSRYDQEVFNREQKDLHGFQIETRGGFGGLNKRSNPVAQKEKQVIPSKRSNLGGNSYKPGNQGGSADGDRQKKISRTPIIIIPAALSSLITAYNAKPFLQEFKYESSQDRRKNAQSDEKAGDFVVHRKKLLMNGEQTTINYRIINNPGKLEPRDWDRVVAVFVQGPKER